MTEDKTATAHFVEGVLITVNKEGQGTVSPGTGVYPKGGTRTFTASPSESWRWDRWEGDINGEDPNDASLELPMDQPRTITAYFIQLVTLTMEKSLVGNLPANGGALSPAVDEEHIYDINTEVTLMASADSGWRFKEWTGGASGTVAPLLLVMDSDKSVTGHFIQQHLVTTEVVINGTIEMTPAGSIFDHGTQVRFDFEEEHSQQPFHHWAGLPDSFSTPEWGAGTSTANPVNVAITESLHVIGYEEDEIVPLTTHVDAEGCEGCAVDPETAEYVVGSYATVTATAPEGWTFDHWEGQVPSEDVGMNPLLLEMTDDKDITAVFDALRTLVISQEGEGTVEPPVNVTYTYVEGDSANISSVAADGWVFDHYTIMSTDPFDIEISDSNPITFPMNADKSVTAVFKQPHTLIISQSGSGSVEPEINVPHVYLTGDTATLSATPAQYWAFSHWSGLSETDFPSGPAGPGTSQANPLQLPMLRDEEIMATFLADCIYELNGGTAHFQTPKQVTKLTEIIEETAGTFLGEFRLKVDGTYDEYYGECWNPDGSQGEVTETVAAVNLTFEATDIPFPNLGFTKRTKIRISGEQYMEVKFTGGLRGDVGVGISGEYKEIAYQCPCLDEEKCGTGTSTFTVDGSATIAADFGIGLSVTARLWPLFGNWTEANICDISLVNASLSAGIKGSQSLDNCAKTSCASIYVSPITVKGKVSALGIGCMTYKWTYPDEKDGDALWKKETCTQ